MYLCSFYGYSLHTRKVQTLPAIQKQSKQALNKIDVTAKKNIPTGNITAGVKPANVLYQYFRKCKGMFGMNMNTQYFLIITVRVVSFSTARPKQIILTYLPGID